MKKGRYGRKGKLGALNDLGNVIINHHYSKNIIKTREMDFRIPLERTEENADLFNYDNQYENEEIGIPEGERKREIVPELGSRPGIVINRIDDKYRNLKKSFGLDRKKWMEWAEQRENLVPTLTIYHGVMQMQPIPYTRASPFHDYMGSVFMCLSEYEVVCLLLGIGKRRGQLIRLFPVTVFPGLMPGFSLQLRENDINRINDERNEFFIKSKGLFDGINNRNEIDFIKEIIEKKIEKKKYAPFSLVDFFIDHVNEGKKIEEEFNFPIEEKERVRLPKTEELLEELNVTPVFIDIISRYNRQMGFAAKAGDSYRISPFPYRLRENKNSVEKILKRHHGRRYMRTVFDYIKSLEYKSFEEALQERLNKHFGNEYARDIQQSL